MTTNTNIDWREEFCLGWDAINDNDNLSKIKKSFTLAFITNLIEEVKREQVEEIADKIQGIDDSGGGSGRRLKIQILGYLETLTPNQPNK